jgi:hypothetical protein
MTRAGSTTHRNPVMTAVAMAATAVTTEPAGPFIE